MNLCNEGMFWCVFEFTFGIGLAVIALAFIGALAGIEFHRKGKNEL